MNRPLSIVRGMPPISLPNSFMPQQQAPGAKAAPGPVNVITGGMQTGNATQAGGMNQQPGQAGSAQGQAAAQMPKPPPPPDNTPVLKSMQGIAQALQKSLVNTATAISGLRFGTPMGKVKSGDAAGMTAVSAASKQPQYAMSLPATNFSQPPASFSSHTSDWWRDVSRPNASATDRLKSLFYTPGHRWAADKASSWLTQPWTRMAQEGAAGHQLPSELDYIPDKRANPGAATHDPYATMSASPGFFGDLISQRFASMSPMTPETSQQAVARYAGNQERLDATQEGSFGRMGAHIRNFAGDAAALLPTWANSATQSALAPVGQLLGPLFGRVTGNMGAGVNMLDTAAKEGKSWTEVPGLANLAGDTALRLPVTALMGRFPMQWMLRNPGVVAAWSGASGVYDVLKGAPERAMEQEAAQELRRRQAPGPPSPVEPGATDDVVAQNALEAATKALNMFMHRWNAPSQGMPAPSASSRDVYAPFYTGM